MRASELEKQAERSAYRAVEVEGDDGWVRGDSDDDESGIAEEEDEEEKAVDCSLQDEKQDSMEGSDSDIPDMASYSNEDNVDEAAVVNNFNNEIDNVMSVRTYDLSITYDNYYATPKLWLYGYAETGAPLNPADMFADISEDHARKTVTMDHHPHIGIQTWAFIHPCKHSAVIKSLYERMVTNGHSPRVDHYLFLFLKFMNAVLPTIEYDQTPGILT